MKKQYYQYSVSELEDEPQVISETLSPDFLRDLLADADATAADEEPGRLEATLSKTGDEVLVQGHIKVKVAVPCSRTLDPAVYDLEPEILLLLKPSKENLDVERRPRRQRNGDAKKEGNRENKQNKKENWQNDPTLADEDAAADCYSGDQLVLDSFIREFILLELPMVPLREDLRDGSMEATRALPVDQLVDGTGEKGEESSADEGEKPIDPRLSPLAEIKARLENKE